MNSTIAYITFRGMLGRKRALLLFALPAMLLLLALGLAATDTPPSRPDGGAAPVRPVDAAAAARPDRRDRRDRPEIDDGQIMYIMTKPIPRPVITLTKLAVAIALVFVFAVIPTVLAGSSWATPRAWPWPSAVGVLIGGIAYCALFVALAVVSRFAVTVGLIYVLVWEVLIGNLAPGARNLSIQQWSLSIVDKLTEASTVEAEVSLGTAGVLLLIVTVAGMFYAAFKLRTLTIASAE